MKYLALPPMMIADTYCSAMVHGPTVFLCQADH